jgi:hypothetical protein
MLRVKHSSYLYSCRAYIYLRGVVASPMCCNLTISSLALVAITDAIRSENGKFMPKARLR